MDLTQALDRLTTALAADKAKAERARDAADRGSPCGLLTWRSQDAAAHAYGHALDLVKHAAAV